MILNRRCDILRNGCVQSQSKEDYDGIKMKSSFILIDVQAYIISVALLENGVLKEYYVEYANSTDIAGNIYKGKVVNILSGLQSAFVDFGGEKNGFLSVDEMLAHRTIVTQAGVIPDTLSISAGDYVMVQATKEPTAMKGARLSTNISLPGRFVVMMPTLDYVGISAKITDENTRARLTELLTKIKPKEGGLIARTVCNEAKKSEIVDEVKHLEKLWENIKKDYSSRKDVSLIYNDGDLVYRSVRDMFNDNIEAIVCNDREMCAKIAETAKLTQPKLSDKIRYYDKKEDMFASFNILSQVDAILSPKVNLPSGGSLVFGYTEALTVIDVNTAKYCGSENHEVTVFNTNIEAANEIARQIRLRNIGGIIVVDFIDMTDDVNREKLLEQLRKAVFDDRAKTRVVEMTSLGLVEITRKKKGREISTVLLDKCPHCGGHSLTISFDHQCRKIMASLKNLFAAGEYYGALVYVNDALSTHMITSRFFARQCETEWADKRIYLVSDESDADGYFIKGCRDSAFNVPRRATLLY